MTIAIYDEHKFDAAPNEVIQISVTTNYLFFFDFATDDPTVAPNLEVSFNYQNWSVLRASMEIDLTEVVRGLADDSIDGDVVTLIRIWNRGNSRTRGSFAISKGRIRTNLLALDDTALSTGFPVRLSAPATVNQQKGQVFSTADIAAMDDSGIILNSVLKPTMSIIRGAANANQLSPRGYSISYGNIVNYAGLTTGELYAYEMERIESLPQWWGGENPNYVGEIYKCDLFVNVQAFIYNGAGATQKRGYRRGGFQMSWTGEKHAETYADVLNNTSPYYHLAGAVNNLTGLALNIEQSVERRPFLFRASAATLSIQFLITGELRWSNANANNNPPISTVSDKFGGFNVRSSVQPIDPDALAEADND